MGFNPSQAGAMGPTVGPPSLLPRGLAQTFASHMAQGGPSPAHPLAFARLSSQLSDALVACSSRTKTAQQRQRPPKHCQTAASPPKLFWAFACPLPSPCHPAADNIETTTTKLPFVFVLPGPSATALITLETPRNVEGLTAPSKKPRQTSRDSRPRRGAKPCYL